MAARITAVVTTGLALGWLLACWIGPSPTRLSDDARGDDALIHAVSRLLDTDTVGFDAMAVALVDGEGTHHATFGQQLDGAPVSQLSQFEIGSLTKPLTGLLLADLIEAGKVEADTTLEQATAGVLSLEGEGANATLSRLARHRSGLPRLPVSMMPRAILSSTRGRNPYDGEPRSVLEAAAANSTSRGDQNYSNLGFAALGNALAAHEGTDYATLLEGRILTPLSMRDTHVLRSEDPLPEQRLQGIDTAGRPIEAWQATGWQAAGVGVWSTADDLSRLATAVLNDTVPGQQALVPPATDGGRHRLGYGWMIRDVDVHEILWHSGGTGGFRSWFGLLPADGRGVVILSNTTRDVDDLGLALLMDDASSDKQPSVLDPPSLSWVDIALTLLLVFGTTLPMIQGIRHFHHRTLDRHKLIRDMASVVSTLALTRILVAWERVPVALWNLGAGFTMTCLLCMVLTWSTTTVSTEELRPVRRSVVTGLLIAWSVLIVALCL